MFERARLGLTLWYVGALAVIVLAVGVAAYLVMRREIDRDINNSIESARGLLLSGAGDEVVAPPPEPNAGGNERDEDDHEDDDHEARRGASVASEIFYVTTAPGGTVLSNPRRVSLDGIPFGKLQTEAGTGLGREDVSAEGHRYRIETVYVEGRAGNAASYLHVGHALDARDRQLRALAIVLSAGGVAGIALSTAGGFWLADRALIPIRRSLEAQRRFVSDASHELRTPLAAIKANNELLQMHPDERIADNRDQVDAIAGEVDQMARLVDDLLTLARADEERLALSLEPLDLAQVAQDVTRDFAAVADSRGVSLRTTVEAAPVEGDSQRLRQLTAILVDNALKYTPSGGAVDVTCGRSGRRAELSVADTGPGIAPEHQRRIFDRFYRVDEARARSAGGAGLGLAIARWIAEAHGGSISVESTPGEGARFTVRLPARR